MNAGNAIVFFSLKLATRGSLPTHSDFLPEPLSSEDGLTGTAGFFFQGMSGNWGFAGGGLGRAIWSSDSTGGALAPGGAMFSRHEAMRACKPWCSAVFLSPAFM